MMSPYTPCRILRLKQNSRLYELYPYRSHRWLPHWFLEHDAVFSAWREDREFLDLVAAVEEYSAAERAKLAGLEIWP